MSPSTIPATMIAMAPPIMAEGSDALPFLGDCAVGVIVSHFIVHYNCSLILSYTILLMKLAMHNIYPPFISLIMAEFGTLTEVTIYPTALCN